MIGWYDEFNDAGDNDLGIQVKVKCPKNGQNLISQMLFYPKILGIKEQPNKAHSMTQLPMTLTIGHRKIFKL